jgi:hypothetical protein
VKNVDHNVIYRYHILSIVYSYTLPRSILSQRHSIDQNPAVTIVHVTINFQGVVMIIINANAYHAINYAMLIMLQEQQYLF